MLLGWAQPPLLVGPWTDGSARPPDSLAPLARPDAGVVSLGQPPWPLRRPSSGTAASPTRTYDAMATNVYLQYAGTDAVAALAVASTAPPAGPTPPPSAPPAAATPSGPVSKKLPRPLYRVVGFVPTAGAYASRAPGRLC